MGGDNAANILGRRPWIGLRKTPPPRVALWLQASLPSRVLSPMRPQTVNLSTLFEFSPVSPASITAAIDLIQMKTAEIGPWN